MSETSATIGQQLDDLGLSVSLPVGRRVVEATVSLVTDEDGEAAEIHEPISLPRQEPGSIPVPHPVERRIVTVVAAGQQTSEDQRKRVASWLKDNGVDPRRVSSGAITIESSMHGDRVGRQLIGFTEYYENPDGHREMNWKTRNEALTYERWVELKVPLEPDPTWKGWAERHAEIAEMKSSMQSGTTDE